MQNLPPLEVRTLDAASEPAWQDFTLSHPDALVYASLEYRNLLEKVTTGEPHYLMALDAGRVCGVLPCFAATNSDYGVVLNSLPYYGSNGGFVTDGRPAVADALADAYLRLESDLGCAASTIVTSPLDTNLRPYDERLQANFHDSRIGQLTPLPRDAADAEKALFDLYDETARRNVRKARKSGVSWRVESSSDDLRFLFETHRENMRAIQGLPKSWSFFEALRDVLPRENWVLYIAEFEGRKVAALLLLRFNRTVEYFTPAIAAEHRTSQPLALLVHEAMCAACRQGYRWWNWGGTWHSQVGVYRFKKKWGAVDMPYRYYTRVLDKKLISAPRGALLEAFPSFFVYPFGPRTNQLQEGAA